MEEYGGVTSHPEVVYLNIPHPSLFVRQVLSWVKCQKFLIKFKTNGIVSNLNSVKDYLDF